MNQTLFRYLLIVFFSVSACKETKTKLAEKSVEKTEPLFTLLTASETNINFQNRLLEGPNANVLVYEYLYNGGGVATGDFNGDGTIDIYFTSNMDENKFYANLGGMKFKDITKISGIEGRKGPWKTGVSAVDINGDGRLDLYLCYSGALPPQKRENELFINQGNDANGNPTFKEMAAEFGLNSPAFSNQGYFFDYDQDGDLDMLLLNHNPKSLPILNEFSTREFLKKDDPLQGVRLYEQNDGRFKDVTVKAGISGSALTYGLGLGISDLNNDGWQDFYISNDYAVPDYLYINNGNSSFTNKLKESIGHTSQFSMGNDIADINNDGYIDVFTLDMLPKDNERQKLLLAPDNYDKFDLNVRSGFHYQYMRNMLQLNNSDGTFSEIGQQAGISNTDWSWSALLADYNNDGWKDLYVTNGYYRDYTNLDFINYMEDYVKSKGRLQRQDVLEIIKKMPSSNLSNYFFLNQKGTSFSDETKAFGLLESANSNGAAYADLDNDGDLDLIVNNINKPAFIYRNNLENRKSHYLQVKLEGAKLNTNGLGAKVTIYKDGNLQVVEQSPTRGYLSTVSPILHFGLGQATEIDSLVIRWNDGKQEFLEKVKSDQVIVLKQKNAVFKGETNLEKKKILNQIEPVLEHESIISELNDFKRQPLLISQISHSGAKLVKGDINNDGLEDVFIGGVRGQAGRMFLQHKGNRFKELKVDVFEKDKESHDTDAIFLDANNDGHMDIYVASGGYHNFAADDILLQDRLYFGNGNNNFIKSDTALPKRSTVTSCVSPSDINEDGFIDLFIGGTTVPGSYPEASQSYILINDGNGNYSELTKSIAPDFKNLKITTDAVWVDLNGDETEDLIVVGEWMPITVFENINGKLILKTANYFDKEYNGWWNTIKVSDLNADGKPDLVVGNIGTNTQFQVSEVEPAELYYADFDENGSIDPIFCFYIEGQSYPYLTRDELTGQLANMKSKYSSYKSYANETIENVFSDQELKRANKYTATHMASTLFLSNNTAKFESVRLPSQAQYSPINTVEIVDVNSDGNEDLMMFGNNHHLKLRLGKFDANYGQLFLGDGTGNFEYINQKESGLKVVGQVNSSIIINDILFLNVQGSELKNYKIRNLE